MGTHLPQPVKFNYAQPIQQHSLSEQEVDRYGQKENNTVKDLYRIQNS